MKGTLPFSRAYLGRLAAVRQLAAALLRGSAPTAVVSGLPVEFDRHRAYQPGDDPRWIDWNIFARLDQLVVKVFQVDEEIDVLVLLDASASMAHGSGGKRRAAAAAAVAFAYLGLLTAHSVSAGRYAERLLDLRGPYRHPPSLPLLARTLFEAPTSGGTDLGASLAFLAASRRRVSVVVVTDGFQREPLERVAQLVARQGHRLLLLLVNDRADRSPRLRGNVHLADAEGGEVIRVLADQALEDQVRGRISRHFAELERTLRALGVHLLSLPVEVPFEQAFLELLRSGGGAVQAAGGRP
jgi:uncharacterized protein (DUF58 family)